MAVIRVSGSHGSGKTTLCRKLAELLHYGYSYTGGIMREMAFKQGVSIEEFFDKLASDPELERSIDNRQAELMNEQDDLVVEGRVAPFQDCPWTKVNILVTVSPAEGARRQLQRPENANMTLDEMLKLSERRLQTERERYRRLYGIQNHLDPKFFDIVIDTTVLTPAEALNTVVRNLSFLGIAPFC